MCRCPAAVRADIAPPAPRQPAATVHAAAPSPRRESRHRCAWYRRRWSSAESRHARAAAERASPPARARAFADPRPQTPSPSRAFRPGRDRPGAAPPRSALARPAPTAACDDLSDPRRPTAGGTVRESSRRQTHQSRQPTEERPLEVGEPAPAVAHRRWVCRFLSYSSACRFREYHGDDGASNHLPAPRDSACLVAEGVRSEE